MQIDTTASTPDLAAAFSDPQEDPVSRCEHDEHGLAAGVGVVGREGDGPWEPAKADDCPDVAAVSLAHFGF